MIESEAIFKPASIFSFSNIVNATYGMLNIEPRQHGTPVDFTFTCNKYLMYIFLLRRHTESHIFPHCGIAAALPWDKIHSRPLVKASFALSSPRSLKVT
jgi:hypothetical protein